jgi:hypothetical protein
MANLIVLASSSGPLSLASQTWHSISFSYEFDKTGEWSGATFTALIDQVVLLHFSGLVTYSHRCDTRIILKKSGISYVHDYKATYVTAATSVGVSYFIEHISIPILLSSGDSICFQIDPEKATGAPELYYFNLCLYRIK